MRTRLVATLTALALLVPLVSGFRSADVSTSLTEHEGVEVTIVRDGYGVPHIYADTDEAVSYGAGYALAQDRLWQMHVFRHIAKGELSEILGPVVVDIDRTVRFYTYTEEERRRRFETYPEDIRRMLQGFADGINAWIDVAQSDPQHMPFEFAEYGELPIREWTVTDSVALGDVLILSFGSGGGNELAHAALLQRLVDRLGEEAGVAAFDDLVRTDDPDDPVTISETFDWRRTSTLARHDDVDARRGLTPDARISLLAERGEDTTEVATATEPTAGARGTWAQAALVPDAQEALEQTDWLQRGKAALEAVFSFGSNAQIVGPALSETLNALQTGGPQVGYMVPQWLADFGLHGGGLDATGMTFAGAGPAVLIGRGTGYAWTTTTGASDLTDTYVEQLAADDPRAYVHDGRVEQMECRTETYTFRGVPFDSDEICRTRHGPVMAFDEDNGVAYALRYAWFDREGQTVEGFFRYNEVGSVEDFATYSNYLASNHNMFYVDDLGHYGFWHPGNHPLRAAGVDLRLPQDGTGGSEWQGLVPIDEVPHAVDFPRSWLVNWNNAPADGWDRERSWPARDNADDIIARYEGERVADPDGGLVNPDGRWDFEDLSANLRYGAFKDHQHTWFASALPTADQLETDLAREALAVVASWDGFLVDRDGDGTYDSAGTTIVDEWVDTLHVEVFGDDLGGDRRWARQSGELWHAVSPDSTMAFGYDWLNGEDPEVVAARAFEAAVGALADRFGNEDPSSWREDAAVQRYLRLNADLGGDLARMMACAELDGSGVGCPEPFQPSNDSGMPGDIPEHIRMDRGTYNHVVQYLDPPACRGGGCDDRTPLGLSASKAGSVIPPGQNGFIDLAGREGPHFEDQLELYVEWRYKPMPLSFDEAMRWAEATETIIYTP